MNNTAIIVRLRNVRAHSNADRLKCATVLGDQIIVDLKAQEGDLGIYFDSNLCLSDEFLKNNNLYRHSEKNVDSTKTGMFEDNGRVKCIKLRGEKSYGFWIPLDSLSFTKGKLDLEEGFEFNDFNGIPICKKYVIPINISGTPGSGKRNNKKPRTSRIIEGQFKFNNDTDQLAKNIHRIHPNDLIVLSVKMHGTSSISSSCIVRRKLNWFEKLLKRIGVNINFTEYDNCYASRRVIKNEFESSKQHFYDEDLWTRVGKEKFEGILHHGETVYYEIVGFTNTGSYIQKSFDYGCNPGEYKVYVYRITYTNDEGKVIELQWNQLKTRCKELGVETVPEIYYGYAKHLFPELSVNEHWHENFLQALKNNYVYDQDSIFCKNKVPEEGIVLRKEGSDIEAYKLKNFTFLNLESKQKDNGENNIEDQN